MRERLCRGTIGTLVMTMVMTGGLIAQKVSPADAATKLSGTWNINRELSPSFTAPPGRGRAGGGDGAAMRPSFSVGGALAGGLAQRGGGGRGGDAGGANGAGDMTPDEIAAQMAMRKLQQIAASITIAATPASVTFTDSTGTQTFAIDDKSNKLEIGGATIAVKSKWDKLALRQEFSSPKSKLIRSWEVDENGRLVLKVKVESLVMMSREVKAVFDKQ